MLQEYDYDIIVTNHGDNEYFLGERAFIKFAGDYHPLVTVQNVKYYEYDVDVIVVHNTSNTPYYLREDAYGVHQSNIYIRLRDTNTPINQSADIQYVECLWKKRFGLDLSPLERMKKYLL